jgi:hypothetical protein
MGGAGRLSLSNQTRGQLSSQASLHGAASTVKQPEQSVIRMPYVRGPRVRTLHPRGLFEAANFKPHCNDPILLECQTVGAQSSTSFKPPVLRGYIEASIQQHRQASDLRGFCLCCGKLPTDPVTGRLPFPQMLSLCAHYRNPCAHPPRKCKHHGGFPRSLPQPTWSHSQLPRLWQIQQVINWPRRSATSKREKTLPIPQRLTQNTDFSNTLPPLPGPFRPPDFFSFLACGTTGPASH